MTAKFTVPYLTAEQGVQVAAVLQERLWALNDLHLLLKHVHWNVTGPNFIAVHEMIDPQVDAVRDMVDAIAERIATLGGAPQGTADSGVRAAIPPVRYDLGRAPALEHLAALDAVYVDLIKAHYAAAVEVEEIDEVTNGLLLGHVEALDLFHWFIRSHLE
jgi:starvation-inducible DNA-binding protein